MNPSITVVARMGHFTLGCLHAVGFHTDAETRRFFVSDSARARNAIVCCAADIVLLHDISLHGHSEFPACRTLPRKANHLCRAKTRNPAYSMV